MSSALNGFDRIAGYYDLLTRLVFGNAIQASQLELLPAIPDGSTVLVIGGGTGKILPMMRTVNPTGSILYVEASSRMLEYAKRNVSGDYGERIWFLHGTEDAIPEGMLFDVIITNFFLDLFSERDLPALCQKLYRTLRPGGSWYATDFVSGGRWWHDVMLWIMYRFFRITSGIRAKSLPRWEDELKATTLAERAFKFFYGGFIKSVQYVKSR